MSEEQRLLVRLTRTASTASAFDTKLARMGSLMAGCEGFAKGLRAEIKLIDEEDQKVRLLEFEGETGQLRDLYRRRLAAERSTIEGILDETAKLITEVGTPAKVRRLSDARFEELSRRVDALLHKEKRRRTMTLRVQGPKVQRVQQRLEGRSLLESSLGEAYVVLAQEIARSQLDPHSKARGLEAWVAADESIWLYHHSETEKWKCLFFRIEVTRAGSDLSLNLECYVPFGIEGDPAQYELETSDVYFRPTWTLGEAVNKSLNGSRSCNLMLTQTETFGHTIGESVSTTEGEAKTKTLQKSTSVGDGKQVGQSRTETDTEGTSEGTSTSESDSESWFDGWNESRGSNSGFSSGDGGRGFNGSTAYNAGISGGTSRGRTTQTGASQGTSSKSVGDTTNLSETKTTTETDGSSLSTGTNKSKTASQQRSTNEAKTKSVAEGRTLTDGETLQLNYKAYGIASGKPAEQHLGKWKEANVEASQVFDGIVEAFESWTSTVDSRLKVMARGNVRTHAGSLESRRPELARLLPYETHQRSHLERRTTDGEVSGLAEVVKSESEIAGSFKIPTAPTLPSGEPGTEVAAPEKPPQTPRLPSLL